MIAIIGGGISGLSLAWALRQQGQDFRLFAPGNGLGGALQSELHQGTLFDYGPNSLMYSKELQQLVQDLGLEDQVMEAAPVSSQRYILKKGRLRALPTQPQKLLFSGFFSPGTRLRLISELWRRSAGPEQETLAQFFRRRFSQEVVDYALAPFVSGIYAGNPEELLLQDTFPMLAQLEAQHGSVLRGLMKNKASTGRRQIVAFRGGQQQLTQALAQALREAIVPEAVAEIAPNQEGWLLRTAEQSCQASRVVLALPAHQAAKLFSPDQAQWRQALEQVHYPPLVSVQTLWPREAVGHPLAGFGALYPPKEQTFALGTIWKSSVFPESVPRGQVLLASFVGGASAPEKAALSEEAILEKTIAELRGLYQIRDSSPTLARVKKWPRAIPQYNAAYLPSKHLAEEVWPGWGLHVCANWYGGVSVPDCIRKGFRLATTLTRE